jgi:hypothetical protein
LAVAAEASPRQQTQPAKREEVVAWVAQFPAKEKDELLVRLMAGEDAVLGAELRSRFNRSRVGRSSVPEAPRRTVRELLAAAKAFREQRQREDARKAAEEKGRQQHLAVIARQKHLDALTGREPELWTQVGELVATKLPKSYDLAVQHLVDLRDLAVRKGADADFSQRLTVLREAHSRKPSFIGRLHDKGLGT